MAWRLIDWVCRDCIRPARTVRGNGYLLIWARRGLPALVIVASAFCAYPARAANASASFSCTKIDNGTCDGTAPTTCAASATLEWSNQPPALDSAAIYVCDDTSNVPCAVVNYSLESPPNNRTSSLSGTNPHALSPSSEQHTFRFIGRLNFKGRILWIESGYVFAYCSG